MTGTGKVDLSAFSLLDLFRSEASTQNRIMADELIALEHDPHDRTRIDALMRAAHSIKGAAAIVNLPQVVALAHQMEDVFVAAQQGRLQLGRAAVDALLAGVDLLEQIAVLPDADASGWFARQEETIAATVQRIALLLGAPQREATAGVSEYAESEPALISVPVATPISRVAAEPEPAPAAHAASPRKTQPRADHALKVSVAHLDRLLSLTSQSVVSAHMFVPVLQSMQRFKKKQGELFALIDALQQTAGTGMVGNSTGRTDAPLGNDVLADRIAAILQAAAPLKHDLLQRLTELETHHRLHLAATQTTLDEVLALRMRPIRDGVQALPRMVRDLAHSLGKEAHLHISGENTPVDRDILAAIESPLNHLLRNAVDHGIEEPQAREAAGKPRQGHIRLHAHHAGGMLHIEVSDDGRGVDLNRIRQRIVERRMATAAMVEALSKEELLEFLFLPAFSLKDATSLVSGRGVGLDVVQAAVRQQYGTVQIDSQPGQGMQTTIILPLTQSVVRSMVVGIGGQAYAIPIARISRVLRLDAAQVLTLENKPFATVDGEHVGLVDAAQLLGMPAAARDQAALPVVLIGSGNRRYGLVVDTLAGEQSLAAQPLEATFGKLKDIAAGALLQNGLPVLILDVADLLLSIEKLLGSGGLQPLQSASGPSRRTARRILVVDDSLTVREMERNLLQSHGYAVDVAVDGIDGWNAVRSADYDLLITDVDMPRMDGIELVTLVKKDARLQALPVMIVSYKDRPEDRARGIQAGADYYLTKGSFHDETLLEAVIDMIGTAPA